MLALHTFSPALQIIPPTHLDVLADLRAARLDLQLLLIPPGWVRADGEQLVSGCRAVRMTA